eukprot:5571691-Alexandrium_andersonii.AAC.1
MEPSIAAVPLLFVLSLVGGARCSGRKGASRPLLASARASLVARPSLVLRGRPQAPLERAEASQVRAALRASRGKAPGLDGRFADEFLLLPDPALEQLIAIFGEVE